MVSATAQQLGARLRSAPRMPLSRHTRLPFARPPSPCIASLRSFLRNADTRFSGSDCRPTTSATTINVRTHPRASDSRESSEVPHDAVTSNALSLSPRFLRRGDLPLSKKNHESHEPRQPFRNRPHGAASTPQTRPRKSSTDRDTACGRRLDPTTVCGGGRWTTTLDCAGRITPSEGSPLRRLLPQYDVGKEIPLLI